MLDLHHCFTYVIPLVSSVSLTLGQGQRTSAIMATQGFATLASVIRLVVDCLGTGCILRKACNAWCEEGIGMSPRKVQLKGHLPVVL